MDIYLPAAAIAVTGSTRYSALASFRAGTTPRNCQTKINWYDSTSALIGSSLSVVVSDGGWQTAGVSATSPPAAVSASLDLIVRLAALGEVHYADKVALVAA
jgi:hypothetical protein